MSKNKPPRIQRVNNIAVALGVLLSFLAIANVVALFYVDRVSDSAHHHHYACIDAANSLMLASDYLTSEARMYVMTGDETYAKNYIRAAYETRRRDKALGILSDDSKHQESLNALTSAYKESNNLSETELYAMNLVAVATGMKNIPSAISEQELNAEDAKLTAEQKKQRAQSLVLGNDYQQSKEAIIKGVSSCTNELIEELREEERQIDTARTALLVTLGVIVMAFVLLLINVSYANLTLIVRPMREHVRNIDEGESLEKVGSQEVQRMVDSYNAMYNENHRKTQRLEQEARTDALTGLLNRGSYDRVLEQNPTDIVLVLMDIDNFKEINDAHGHAAGDEALKHVAACIAKRFRASDSVCRIGGDEFAVIMTRMNGVDRSIVREKLSSITEELHEHTDDCPTATLSIGVAFSSDLAEGVNIYHAADQALYKAKGKGRDQTCFYE